jgi:divalent metal cation (Fe/Co/Zn/Cd) transporter
MKLSMKHYWKPTPKKWRKIGDAILATTTFVTAGGLISYEELRNIFSPQEIKVTIAICLILGVLSKFLTNFFKAEASEVIEGIDHL